MVIKNLPTNKSPETESFTGESYQTLRGQLTLILLQLFKNHCRGKNTPKLILQGHHHPDTKTRPQKQDTTQKENYRPISLMNIDTKVLNKVLENRTQRHMKRIKHYSKWDSSQGCQGFLSISKSINVTHHINKLKNKNHMIISIDAEKLLTKSNTYL